MSYKIAVAASGGEIIDASFGAADFFDIYEVDESGYHFLEKREFCVPKDDGSQLTQKDSKTENAVENLAGARSAQGSCGDAGDCGSSQGSCGSGDGCGNGRESNCGSGSGGGCGAAGNGMHPKVELISDCRCVICKKIGFQIQKQLEKRAIISFDVDCTVGEALEKITAYLARVDSHQSLRGFAQSS